MFALKGAVEFGSDVDPAAALARVDRALRKARARDLHYSGQTIAFRGGMFRLVTRYNVLNAFSSGAVTIDPARLETRYELHVDQLPVLALFMIAVIALLNAPLWAALVMPLLIFIGVPLDLARFRRLLRNAVNGLS